MTTEAVADILLVEDEEAHAELVERAFESSSTCRLAIVGTVRGAKDRLATRPPDLVITDLWLPDGSGTELLRSSPSPVIVMTSQADEAAAVAVMKAGALDYIVKSEETFWDMPHIVERSLRACRLQADRDEIEHQRVRADERLRIALSNAPIRAMTQDRDLRISWVHDPSLGSRATEIIGKTDLDLLPKDSADRVMDIKRRALETAEPVREEVILVEDGEARVYDLSVFPHPDAAGATAELTSVSVDITERRELERVLKEKERLASVGMAASILAHEIGNPLNNMFLNAQVLHRRIVNGSTDESVASGLGTIMGEIRRLNTLLAEFRSLSRRETLSLRPTDVGALLALVLDQTTPGAPRVRIERELRPGLDVPADSDKLFQAFLNLCKNACEAMPSGGTLTVHAAREDDSLVVEIADTGNGIPEDVNAFEAFRTTKEQGTGLGLPIVRQIVTAHAGTVSYESTLGEGTVFKVVLPASRKA